MHLQLPHLPILRTSDQAVALAEQHHDLFYLAAFKIQLWMSDLLAQAMATYTEKPDPADRLMQTGQAWRAFQPVFGAVCDKEFHHVINFLIRFSECENPVSRNLLAALVLVYREHEASGGFLSPKSRDILRRPHRAPGPLIRRSVERMCDWLDSVVQISTHILWIHRPACFDPDPETRRLATDEVTQPCVAEMDEPALVLPYLQPRAATSAPSIPHPVPSAVALAKEGAPAKAELHTPHSNPRPWPFARLDESIITIWPLLKLHNWTYADLWNVLDQGGIPLAQTPARDHRHLADYCFHALGLRKSGHGQTTRNSLPPGHKLAHRLMGHFHRRSRPLGRGPWS